MSERIPLERRDGRNLLVVVAVMSVVLAVLAQGPALARVVAGILGGLFSGVVFVVVTLALNVYKARSL